MPTNLVFVFADQMRGHDMACAGNRQVATPNLDAMAAEGVRFTNAVSTCPVCTPYRAALLTGRFPISNGMCMNDVRLPPTETTIAHVLRTQGYATGYIGKWHLDGPYRGGFTPPGWRRQGFEYWAAADCTHAYMRSHYYRDDPRPVWIDGYDADHFTDLTIDYIRENADRPFCLFLSWGPPHNPYEDMPPEYNIYAPDEMVLRENVPPGAERLARTQYAGYYGHITALDHNVGRIRRALEECGIDEDTLFVFTSDHGDMLQSHAFNEKQLPYEESILVPFLACQPGTIPARATSDAVLDVTDLMPTMLSYLGVDCPDTVEGRDLSPALFEEDAEDSGSALIANPTPFRPNRECPAWRGVRTRTHTYVRAITGPWMLFDNVADPFQMRNLVNQPQVAGLQQELEAELTRWLDKIGDEFLPMEEYVERFRFAIQPGGHPFHHSEVGLHDPMNP